MRQRFLLLSLVILGAVGAALWLAALGLPGVGETTRQASFEERIRSYLIANPEVLNEAADAFQRRRRAEEAAARIKVMAGLKGSLRAADGLPVMGNPEGDVTVVEFFDYRCPYCKQALDELRRLVASDKNVRLVFREFPILGPQSLVASRAAIAAREQGKYVAMHIALMEHKGDFSEAAVMTIAKAQGLDVDRLRADMKKPEVMAIINRTLALAGKLGVEATPTLVVGDEVHPGYLDSAGLKELVARARSECKTC